MELKDKLTEMEKKVARKKARKRAAAKRNRNKNVSIKVKSSLEQPSRSKKTKCSSKREHKQIVNASTPMSSLCSEKKPRSENVDCVKQELDQKSEHKKDVRVSSEKIRKDEDDKNVLYLNLLPSIKNVDPEKLKKFIAEQNEKPKRLKSLKSIDPVLHDNDPRHDS